MRVVCFIVGVVVGSLPGLMKIATVTGISPRAMRLSNTAGALKSSLR